jgi:nucleoid DNA-binding protein
LGKNPQTGKEIVVAGIRLVKSKEGTEFADNINN